MLQSNTQACNEEPKTSGAATGEKRLFISIHLKRSPPGRNLAECSKLLASHALTLTLKLVQVPANGMCLAFERIFWVQASRLNCRLHPTKTSRRNCRAS